MNCANSVYSPGIVFVPSDLGDFLYCESVLGFWLWFWRVKFVSGYGMGK